VQPKPALGADLVVPLLGVGFAAYFFWSIADLAWEAKANGVIIGTVLVVLALAQVLRIAVRVAKGRASLATAPLWQPADVLGKRIGMVLVTIAFIAALQVLGLTLALLLAMAAALVVMGVRKPLTVLWISAAVATAAYVLFIAVLDSAFPHGLIEKLLS
jgi:hypothetical protein